MELYKIYKDYKCWHVAFVFLSCFAFFGSFFLDEIGYKVLIYIFFGVSVCFHAYMEYKFLTFKKEIKNKITKVIEIKVKNIYNMSSSSKSGKYYYGYKIDCYLYFNKNIPYGSNDNKLYRKLIRYKKIRVEVYPKTKVIKKILTNL